MRPKPYVLLAFQKSAAERSALADRSVAVLIAAAPVCQSSNKTTLRSPRVVAAGITTFARCGGTVREKSRYFPSSPSYTSRG